MTTFARSLRMPVLVLAAALPLVTVPVARAGVDLEATLDAQQETPTPALYTATLDAAQETPTPTVGSHTPTGTAKLALNADHTLTYTVTVQDLTGAALLAHVHEGAVGVPGDVVVSLDASTLTGTTAALTADQVTQLQTGDLYVNVHTLANTAGEIRGQITAIPVPSGTATFVLDQAAKTLQYTITRQNPSGPVFLAHLHKGAPGVAGPALVTLDNSLTGTTAPLTDTLINDLFDGNMYVNVHTALNGNGEIRGQVQVKRDAAETCACSGVTRKAFLACINGKIRALDAGDKKSAAAKALRRAAKLSSCGKKKVPKRALACCLPQAPLASILVGRVCAAMPAKVCTKKGGTSLGAGSTCLPENPCTPPASPSGAFLDASDAGAP